MLLYRYSKKRRFFYLLLNIKNVQIFRNLVLSGVELPHKVRLKTENGEFSAVIDFLKQYENYIRVEGKIAVSEKQRFELNLLNDQNEAKIKIKKVAQS